MTDRPAAPPFEMTGAHVRREGRAILSGVDLRVGTGEVVAVLGPNGAGKSTLVKALLGLVPLAAGTTAIYGEPPARFRAWHRIGYVPQRLPMGGGIPATVREVVASGRVTRRSRWLPVLFGDRAADRDAVDRALTAVGLADRARDSAHLLSGGEQQRVLIARALAGEPDVFVMDEPTAGVDARNQAALASALHELADGEHTVVLVTHELGPLEPLVTRTIELGHGRVVRDAVRDTVRDTAAHGTTALGRPA